MRNLQISTTLKARTETRCVTIARNSWDRGSHNEQHCAQLLMQHVTQPCKREFFCNQNKDGVGSHKAAAIIVFLLWDEKKNAKNRNHRVWVRKWVARRQQRGTFRGISTVYEVHFCLSRPRHFAMHA